MGGIKWAQWVYREVGERRQRTRAYEIELKMMERVRGGIRR